MVILGGLEVVAAGYLIHKHNQNKRERSRLREAEELIEAEEAAIRRHNQKLQEAGLLAPRRRRSDSRDRKHSHHHRRRRDEDDSGSRHRQRREQSAPPPVTQTQTLVAPGIVAGWPAHWEQSQKPQPDVKPPGYGAPQVNYAQLHPGYGGEKRRSEGRRGRSADDLRSDRGLEREREREWERESENRSPSPRVRFDDGYRPGEGKRSPPPRYS